VGATGYGCLWALAWATLRTNNKLALRTRPRNLKLRSLFTIFDSFRTIHVHIYDLIRVHIYDFLKFVGLKWALQTFLKSINFDESTSGILENSTFQLKCLLYHRICGSVRVGVAP